MSSSNSRTNTARVFRPDDDGPGLALALWDPAPSSGDGHADRLAVIRQSGFDEGYAQAQAEIKADWPRVRTALMDAAATVAATRVEAVATMTSEVVELALELSQVILQRELRQSDAGVEAFARALRLAPSGDDLLVRLHPDDSIEIAETELLAPGVSVKVIADASIERGGCVLEVGPCRIDTQVGPAIRRARALIADDAATTELDQL